MDWLIKKLGGYTKDEILNEVVARQFSTISYQDILREEGLDWYFQDNKILEAEKKLLIAEASQFLNTRLWKVLKTDIRYQANKIMFEKAKTELDMTAGKLWLYTLDCLETRLKSMKGESGRFNLRQP